MVGASGPTMKLTHVLFAFASLGLLHCSSMDNKTTPNGSGDQSTTLSVTLSLPTDTTGHTAEIVVGQPAVVDVSVAAVGPGACDSTLLGSHCTEHTVTQLSQFGLADVACDGDLCEVTSVTRDAGRASAQITLVPKTTSVNLHASATSGPLSGSGALWLAPADH